MEMSNSSKKTYIFGFIILMIVVHCASAAPMLYKKNPDDKYEADLIAVSSTVIPLSVLEVSYGIGGKPSEEYKEAYFKKLRKKIQNLQDTDPYKPDTLITVKTKSNEGSRAKVKGVADN